MTKQYPRKHYAAGKQRFGRRRQKQSDSPLAKGIQYLALSVVAGLALAGGWNAYERHQARQAALAALPPGYRFSGCNEVRARGLDPLQSYEPGYSERMDGDGDGIACEPYRR